MRILAFCISFLIFCSCNKERVYSDDRIEYLAGVVREVQVVEVALVGVKRNLRDSMKLVYYGQMLEIQKIDQDSLEGLLEILKKDTELATIVYRKATELKENKPDK